MSDRITTELFTVQEVAARFRVKPRTVYRWIRDGRLNSIPTPGGQHRISGEEVRSLFAGMVEEPESAN